jgi:selenocysteine-specific elongation factor
MVDAIQQEIRQKGRITLSEVRDLFNTSRKYAQALLEHLDAIGITVRAGDFRTLKQK